MKIRLSHQVGKFLRSLPPIPKKRIRSALRDLASMEGDLKELEAPLDGYIRLRVHQYRIILKMSEKEVDCIFIERRSVVYELFAAQGFRESLESP